MVGTKFTRTQAAHQIVAGEKARVQRHVSFIAACRANSRPEGPGIMVVENLVRENLTVLHFRFQQVLIAPEPTSRYGIGHLYSLLPDVVRPPNPQGVAGSLALQFPHLNTCGARRLLNHILGHERGYSGY